MPNANAPAGPGKPLHEREDAVEEQEGIAELDRDRGRASGDPATGARHAERDAHANDDGAGGAGRHQNGRGA